MIQQTSFPYNIPIKMINLLGLALRAFGACPWNYEDYDWDFWGLICLEYAPLWYLGSYIVDQYVIPYVLNLQWKGAVSSNGKRKAH